MTFYDLGITPLILKSIEEKGYEEPTPIQAQAIPMLLMGKDVLGSAQTGTGKTAAFAVPILQKIYEEKQQNKRHKISALILAPTRELANQIAQSFQVYGKRTGLKHIAIFGGVSINKQQQAIHRGVDIVIATPGRLLDLLHRHIIKLNDIKYLVLDEADRMLDMGFIVDIKKIIKYIPIDRQTMLFSATMPKAIEHLAKEILNDHTRITVSPVTETIDQISQRIYHVNKKQKTALLLHLINELQIDSALVFTRTKHGADRLQKEIMKSSIHVETIHGNKSQNARERALANFKKGKTNILVATDVASRGIDIKKLSFVINYDLPEDGETYIHRIGRTGRAGLSGVALSFCDMPEIKLLRNIERHIRQVIDVVGFHPYVTDMKSPVPIKQNKNYKKKKFYYQSNKTHRTAKA